MHDRIAIRALAADGVPIRAIARKIGADRNAVRRALAEGAELRYMRADIAVLDELEPAIAETLARYPKMPAAGVARRLRYRGGMSAFTARVRRARREVLDGASRSPG